MRISDWSSDVCSSDLYRHPLSRRPPERAGLLRPVQDDARARRCRTRHPFCTPPAAACSDRRDHGPSREPLLKPAPRRLLTTAPPYASTPSDRQSVWQGKIVSVRVDLGGRRNVKKKKKDT